MNNTPETQTLPQTKSESIETLEKEKLEVNKLTKLNNLKGLSILLFITTLFFLSTTIYLYQKNITIFQSLTTPAQDSNLTNISADPIGNQSSAPTPTPTPRAIINFPNYTTFPNEHFDFISMQIPEGWTIETKAFGQENTAGFASYYTPECDIDRCAGINIVKDNAKLEMVFNYAFGSAGFLCTSNTSYFTKLTEDWTRINHPTDPEDSYAYKYTYNDKPHPSLRYDISSTANDDWYFPKMSFEYDSENEFAFCSYHEPLVSSERIRNLVIQVNDETGEDQSIPMLVATDPKLFSTNQEAISKDILNQADQIISSITYTRPDLN